MEIGISYKNLKCICFFNGSIVAPYQSTRHMVSIFAFLRLRATFTSFSRFYTEKNEKSVGALLKQKLPQADEEDKSCTLSDSVSVKESTRCFEFHKPHTWQTKVSLGLALPVRFPP